MKSPYKIAVLLVGIVACKPHHTAFYQPTVNQEISQNEAADSITQATINPYTEGMAKAMNEVIGTCYMYLEKKKPSSTLGNFMADAIYEIAKSKGDTVDFCLLNYGGIRSTLDSGEITVSEVFQLMPFENEICIVKLSKEQLKEVLQIIKEKGGEPFSAQLVDIAKKIDTAPRLHYFMATNDYMANGGDEYTVLSSAVNRIDTGLKIRDALISYIEMNIEIILDESKREL